MIRTLGRFNGRGERREGRVGIWVDRGGGREEKIGAIGVRIRHWVSFHGFALNVDPDLDHFAGIVPCGIAEHGVTSLTALGLPVSMAEVDAALKASFRDVFGGWGVIRRAPPCPPPPPRRGASLGRSDRSRVGNTGGR